MVAQPKDSQAGFSIVSVLMGVALIGIGAAVILKSSELFQTQSNLAKTQPVMSRYVTQLTSGATRMLLETGEKGNQTDGICRFVGTDAVGPGVGSITLDLPSYEGKSQTAFSEKHWEGFFPGWDLVQLNVSKGCHYSDNWRRCFKLDASNRQELSNQKFKDLDLIGSVQIIPTFTNPNKGLFKRIAINDDSRSFDVKDVGFLIVAEVSYLPEKNAKQRKTKRLSDFIWAPTAGICDKVLPNRNKVLLSLAGSGASNADGKTVYNRSQFSGDLESPLFVDFRKTQIQEGKVSDNGRFISTDVTKNIAVSCNERQFRCPLTNSSKRTYAPLDVTIDLEYNPRNSLVGFAASLTLNPRLQISRGYGDISTDLAESDYSLDGKSGSSFRVSGTHQLVARVNDKTDHSTANNLCREICTESNSYNRGRDSSSNRYRPTLSFFFSEANTKKFKHDTDEEVGCTACYMKNCAQIGLGTFGPMNQQPDQPLDSNIPECWVTEPVSTNSDPYRNSPSFKIEDLTETTEECISASLSATTDQLVLKPKNCTAELPVICYGFGNFVVSRKLSGTNWSLDRRPHNLAAKACYDMGFEIINAESIRALIPSSNGQLPRAERDGTIRFQNLAQQGIFLAPQLGKDVASLRRWTTSKGISGEFWVALQYKNKQVRAIAPKLVNVELKDDINALFYDTNGRIKIENYNIDLDTYGTGQGELLFHHMKFKGILNANAVQKKALRYLCRHKDGYFFASSQTNTEPAAGDSICDKEKGKFIRPETPMDWLQGLLATQPLMDSLPYVDPDLKVEQKLDPVWIAQRFVDDPLPDPEPNSSKTTTIP